MSRGEHVALRDEGAPARMDPLAPGAPPAEGGHPGPGAQAPGLALVVAAPPGHADGGAQALGGDRAAALAVILLARKGLDYCKSGKLQNGVLPDLAWFWHEHTFKTIGSARICAPHMANE